MCHVYKVELLSYRVDLHVLICEDIYNTFYQFITTSAQSTTR